MMIIRPGQPVVLPGMGMTVSSGRAFGGGGFAGVLDGISDVAAAYSLRKLRSAYAGSAVRVRRSSDSTEQDIGFDGSGEFDSAAFSSFVGGGTGYVRTWYDQGGNGNDCGQATTGTQPSITLSAINSKPAVAFSGSKALLRTGVSIGNDVSVMVVARQINTSRGAPFYLRIGDYISTVEFNQSGSSIINDYHRSGALASNESNSVPYTANTWVVASSVLIGSNSVVRNNGGGTQTSVLNAFTSRATQSYYAAIGTATAAGGAAVAGTYLNGDIGEIVLINASVSTTDHNTIGNDMATRYGISWTTVT